MPVYAWSPDVRPIEDNCYEELTGRKLCVTQAEKMAVRKWDTAGSEAWSPEVSKEWEELKECQETVEGCIIKARIEINVLQHSLSSHQRTE